MDTAPKARPAESEQKPGIPMNILDEPDVIGKRTAKRVVKIAAEPIPAEDLEARRRASSIAAAKTEHPSILKKSKEVMSAPSIKDGLTKRDEDRAARFADLEARSRASSIAAAKVEHPSILRKRKEVIAAYKEWLWDFNCCPSKLYEMRLQGRLPWSFRGPDEDSSSSDSSYSSDDERRPRMAKTPSPPPEPERHQMPDGVWYTPSEFEDQTSLEHRRAEDGRWYTQTEFEEHFKDRGVVWNFAEQGPMQWWLEQRYETAEHETAGYETAVENADDQTDGNEIADYFDADNDRIAADFEASAGYADSDFLWDDGDDEPYDLESWEAQMDPSSLPPRPVQAADVLTRRPAGKGARERRKERRQQSGTEPQNTFSRGADAPMPIEPSQSTEPLPPLPTEPLPPLPTEPLPPLPLLSPLPPSSPSPLGEAKGHLPLLQPGISLSRGASGSIDCLQEPSRRPAGRGARERRDATRRERAARTAKEKMEMSTEGPSNKLGVTQDEATVAAAVAAVVAVSCTQFNPNAQPFVPAGQDTVQTPSNAAYCLHCDVFFDVGTYRGRRPTCQACYASPLPPQIIVNLPTVTATALELEEAPRLAATEPLPLMPGVSKITAEPPLSPPMPLSTPTPRQPETFEVITSRATAVMDISSALDDLCVSLRQRDSELPGDSALADYSMRAASCPIDEGLEIVRLMSSLPPPPPSSPSPPSSLLLPLLPLAPSLLSPLPPSSPSPPSPPPAVLEPVGYSGKLRRVVRPSMP
jgi:hypothetical protein